MILNRSKQERFFKWQKNKDDLESLMNMFKKRVYPLPLLDAEDI